MARNVPANVQCNIRYSNVSAASVDFYRCFNTLEFIQLLYTTFTKYSGAYICYRSKLSLWCVDNKR
uniref:Uncharacterized protein n=1 Tax=Anguilla anguilla TaxID=7936 RepID=A0A0E9VH70_ANGAN